MIESYKEDGKPSLQFYVDDWLSEPGLRLCSLAARGLWIDMLSYMFKSQIRGALLANEKKIGSKELAKLVGENEDYVKKLLEELQDSRVLSYLENGTIINRRMYYKAQRERKIKEVRMEAGRKGGLAKGKQKESKKESKKEAKQAPSSSIPSSNTNERVPKGTLSQDLKGKNKKEKQEKDYGSQELLSYFGKKYKEQFNITYFASFKKEVTLFNNLLKLYNPPHILDLIDIFFVDVKKGKEEEKREGKDSKESKWVADKASVGVFFSQVNKLNISLAKIRDDSRRKDD